MSKKLQIMIFVGAFLSIVGFFFYKYFKSGSEVSPEQVSDSSLVKKMATGMAGGVAASKENQKITVVTGDIIKSLNLPPFSTVPSENMLPYGDKDFSKSLDDVFKKQKLVYGSVSYPKVEESEIGVNPSELIKPQKIEDDEAEK